MKRILCSVKKQTDPLLSKNNAQNNAHPAYFSPLAHPRSRRRRWLSQQRLHRCSCVPLFPHSSQDATATKPKSTYDSLILLQTPEFSHVSENVTVFLELRVHPKTLIEIAMVLSTNRSSFPSNSHVSITFSILLRCGEFCLPQPYAGRRTDFRDKKSSDFSGVNFRERNYCPRTAFSGSNSCSILSNQVFS